MNIAAALAEIAARPPASWGQLVRERWPDDPELARQALVWLHANRERDDASSVPALHDDRYALGVMLDAGGTAHVWQAHDRKLGRNVAIKLFRVERSPSLDEILTEARAACEVDSDHVVRVLDVHDDEPPYIVMELVGEYEPRRGVLAPGASAATFRPASTDEAVRWVRDVALGVHDAHLRNVFHRDIKPHNVLITPWSRRARIGDFGLAVSASGSANASGLVRTGPTGPVRVSGTPEYMAPEQARGLPLVLDPHDESERAILVGVDVWGLGALAYDLLSGHPPWRPRDGLDAWEVAATGGAPALPAPVPRRLARVIAKALAPETRDRYATAAELASELDAYIARRPTSHDRSRATRLALWCRRNPQLTITAGLASVLAVITLVAYATILQVRSERNDLAADIDRLAERAGNLRRELAETEANLKSQTGALDNLRKVLAEEKIEYDAIVGAKERALRDADAVTKTLVEQLSAARADRDTAQGARDLYEGFWTRARADSDRPRRSATPHAPTAIAPSPRAATPRPTSRGSPRTSRSSAVAPAAPRPSTPASMQARALQRRSAPRSDLVLALHRPRLLDDRVVRILDPAVEVVRADGRALVAE
jgi:serine/threonine protein kinase